MAKPNKINLRAFQQELSERLKNKTAAQVDSLRLALECGDVSWLVRLGDTGEVLPMPEPVPVPLTKPWFLGVANIRGGLFGMVDFGAFLTGKATARAAGARLVLLGTRFSEVRSGLMVNKVLGLRNLADFAPAEAGGVRPWAARTWHDKNGAEWRELDLARLAQDEEFLQIEA
ncbi:MAG: chemotaxis protein CheW [Betaproteobacteria bacterium]|nr:chemotaxis protein CheW [Betaproteobacteria bacterium]